MPLRALAVRPWFSWLFSLCGETGSSFLGRLFRNGERPWPIEHYVLCLLFSIFYSTTTASILRIFSFEPFVIGALSRVMSL